MMNLKNIFKKNQIMIYTIALMLITAGYFNYTNNVKDKDIETSVKEVRNDGEISEINKQNETKASETKEGDSQNISALVENDNNSFLDNNLENSLSQTNKESKEDNKKIAEIGDATLVNSNDVIKDDYFAKAKIEREAMYSQMQETYQSILNSSYSMDSQKEMASVEMARINETKNCIMICENLLETKGFENCVVFVNDESVSVIVGIDELKSEQIAQIQNIISRELGAIVENIHISTKS